jgi:peroxiredoxin
MYFRYRLLAVVVLAALGVTRAQEPPADEVGALLQEYQQRERAYWDAARAAGVKADPSQHPAREYLPRFKALAEQHAGQPAALPALTWILEQGRRMTYPDPKAETCWVVERLTHDHAGQPEIAAALQQVHYAAWRLEPAQVQALYDAVLAQNQDHAVCAQATFQKGAYLVQSAEKMDDPKPARQQALQLLRAVKKTYKDTEYAKQADGWIFELQKLQVGMKAPEIVGVDLDGQAIKLSDYAGYVVVIDFWETTFKSCRDALPRERDLMSMFGDQPFTILGINTDRNRKELKSFLRDNKITWPNIYDGTSGAVAKEWNVHTWPMRYVLDHHGIIRYRGPSDARVEETVRELMKKLPPSKQRPTKKP